MYYSSGNSCLVSPFSVAETETGSLKLGSSITFSLSPVNALPWVATRICRLVKDFIFQVDNRSYALRQDLQYIVTEENNFYLAENDVLGSCLGTESYDDLIRIIYSELDFLWRNYALEQDDKLTLEARRLKAKVLSYLLEV